MAMRWLSRQPQVLRKTRGVSLLQIGVNFKEQVVSMKECYGGRVLWVGKSKAVCRWCFQPREPGGCRAVVSVLRLRAEGRSFMAVSKLRSEVMEGWAARGKNLMAGLTGLGDYKGHWRKHGLHDTSTPTTANWCNSPGSLSFLWSALGCYQAFRDHISHSHLFTTNSKTFFIIL